MSNPIIPLAITEAMAGDRDWYWISEDGERIFSSARATIVGPSDAGYRAWLERSGRRATAWPPDE